MGRRRHAAGRPLRHAQAVRTHRHLLVLRFSAAQRHAAQEAVHAGRELPVEVAQRHTSGAHGAGHGAGTVRVSIALRVRGQRRVRPRDRWR